MFLLYGLRAMRSDTCTPYEKLRPRVGNSQYTAPCGSLSSRAGLDDGCDLLAWVISRYISVAVGLYYIGAALTTVGLLGGYKFARYTWHMHDFVIGHLLFIILFVLSALQFPSTVQV